MSARDTAGRQNGDDKVVPLAVAQIIVMPAASRIRRVVIKGGAAATTIDIKRNGASILNKSNQASGVVGIGIVVSFEYGGRQDCVLALGDTFQITSTQSDALISADFMRA